MAVIKLFEVKNTPEFRAKRKKEWRHIKRILDHFTYKISKKYQPYHKHLFFTGEFKIETEGWYKGDPDKYIKDRYYRAGGDEYFAVAMPLFELWYHPNPDEATAKAIFDKQTHDQTLHQAQEWLFDVFLEAGCSFYDREYGMLGGREELAVKMLVPSYDFGPEYVRTLEGGGYPLCLPPSVVLQKCCGGTRLLLSSNESLETPNVLPGYFLWDHLSHTIGQVTNEPRINWFKEVLMYIVNFYDREGNHRNNPAAIALADKLRARFEAREFSDALMAYWDEVKAEYEAEKGVG